MTLYYVLPALTLLLIIAAVLILKNRKQPESTAQPLTPNEMMFRSVLEKAVGGRHAIYDKVPVTDVLQPVQAESDKARRKALKPVQGRFFDYLVCDRDTRQVLCAVELDDHAYDKKSYKKNDLFLEQVCADARLPLLRVPKQNGYNLSEIIERFERTVASIGPAEAPVYTAKNALCVKAEYSPAQ